MKLTAKLALNQLKVNRRRTIWTLLGIVLSVAVITAVFSFAVSGIEMYRALLGDDFYRDGRFQFTLGILAATLSAIVMIVSIIVVSNAFRVSAVERTVQFGILKSVGATKKQIRQTVLYEGILLSGVGIPVGIGLGFVVAIIGMQIANHFLESLNAINNHLDIPIELNFIVSWQVIVLSILVAFITIILSAWLPAQKAAAIPAISAIRGLNEIKVSAKKIHTSLLVQALFKFEGTLAMKQLKRNKRNFRATVVSISIGIVLFLTAFAISASLEQATGMLWPETDATVWVNYASPVTINRGADDETAARFLPLDTNVANRITARLRAYEDTIVFGIGTDRLTYRAVIPEGMPSSDLKGWLEGAFVDGEAMQLRVNFIVIDSYNYAEVIRRAGVPYGSNLLINHALKIDRASGLWHAFRPYTFVPQTLLIENAWETGETFDLALHGELHVADLPPELRHASTLSYLSILVYELNAPIYDWLAIPYDKSGFMAHAERVLQEELSEVAAPEEALNFAPAESATALFVVRSLLEPVDAIRNIGRMIMIFVYGFAALLILIGLTNVISTISTNVRSRAREFAVLQSVGMDSQGLQRMLNFESLFCSLKSLMFGLPLGILATVLIHIAIADTAAFPYEFPWRAVIKATIFVFVITWVVTRYSARRLKGQNIIEAIRSESGV